VRLRAKRVWQSVLDAAFAEVVLGETFGGDLLGETFWGRPFGGNVLGDLLEKPQALGRHLLWGKPIGGYPKLGEFFLGRFFDDPSN
jgi:hypothetical protein